MEVQAYRTARHGPALGLVVRLLIGLLVGLIGGPLWLFLIAQIGFELFRTTRKSPSEYPVLGVAVAVLGWLIGFLA